MAAATTELKSGWQWKQREATVAIGDELGRLGWTMASAMPSEIHLELMKVGRIPDPYIADNEHKIQCESARDASVGSWHERTNGSHIIGVGEREWLYATTFEFAHNSEHIELVFEGLDTLCHIYLVDRASDCRTQS